MTYCEIDDNLKKLTAYSFIGFLYGLLDAKEKGLYPETTSCGKTGNVYTVFLIPQCVPYKEFTFSIMPADESARGLVLVSNLLEACNVFNYITLQNAELACIDESTYKAGRVRFKTTLTGYYNNANTGESQIAKSSARHVIKETVITTTTFDKATGETRDEITKLRDVDVGAISKTAPIRLAVNKAIDTDYIKELGLLHKTDRNAARAKLLEYGKTFDPDYRLSGNGLTKSITKLRATAFATLKPQIEAARGKDAKPKQRRKGADKEILAGYSIKAQEALNNESEDKEL